MKLLHVSSEEHLDKYNATTCVIDVPLQHLLNRIVCIDSEPMAIAHNKTSNIPKIYLVLAVYLSKSIYLVLVKIFFVEFMQVVFGWQYLNLDLDLKSIDLKFIDLESVDFRIPYLDLFKQ